MHINKDGFAIASCVQCGAQYFPKRLICHRCGGDRWNEVIVREALIEEVTTVERAIGVANGEKRHLAAVRTADGLSLIVGLDSALSPGTKIAIFGSDRAPFGRPVDD